VVVAVVVVVVIVIYAGTEFTIVIKQKFVKINDLP
jgi:hypothetical protein